MVFQFEVTLIITRRSSKIDVVKDDITRWITKVVIEFIINYVDKYVDTKLVSQDFFIEWDVNYA